MPDDTGEFSACHREPQILENSIESPTGRGELFRDSLYGDELVAHMREPGYSWKVTSRVARASAWSSTMPTSPITRMAVITLVMERLFGSFHAKYTMPV